MRVKGTVQPKLCSLLGQWMLCSEWVPSEWESMDALQWMGAVRMRVNGCSAVNGCHQNESHSDGTHSLQRIHWLSFWWHPFTAEHPLTLILTAPIHCRASIDSHSDGTHSLMQWHISPKQMNWGSAHFHCRLNQSFRDVLFLFNGFVVLFPGFCWLMFLCCCGGAD